jgi:hypothetical protein
MVTMGAMNLRTLAALAPLSVSLLGCGSPTLRHVPEDREVVLGFQPPAASAPAPASNASPAAPAGVAEATDAGAPKSSTPSPTKPPADPSASPKERLMRSHFRETVLIRNAVIDGTPAKASAPALTLSQMDELGAVEPGWEPFVEKLQEAGRRIQMSPDTPGVAAATADIGVACGGCHRAAGGPTVKVDAPPAKGSTLQTRMARHAWATERLWEALYVPSDPSWKAGVEALVDDPFPKEILEKGGVHGRSAAERFKTILSTAGAKKKVEDRAKVYASLLETCSACHVATRK